MSFESIGGLTSLGSSSKNKKSDENANLTHNATLVSDDDDNNDEDNSDEDTDMDEWLDMENIDQAADDGKSKSVQVTIKAPTKKTKEQLERERWMKEIRLEIARRRRARFEDMHRMHILCYIAHLRFHVSAVLESQAMLADLLDDIIPSDILAFGPLAMDKVVQLFRPIFRLCQPIEIMRFFADELRQSLPAKRGARRSAKKRLAKAKVVKMETDATASSSSSDFVTDALAHVRSSENYARYLRTLITRKCFSSNLDLAVVEEKPMKEEHAKLNDENMPPKVSKKKSSARAAAGSPSKLMDKARKEAKTVSDQRNSTAVIGKKPPRRRGPAVNYDETEAGEEKRKYTEIDNEDDEKNVKKVTATRRRSSAVASSTSSSLTKRPRTSVDLSKKEEDEKMDTDGMETLTPLNHWMEFYDDADRKWICLSPTFAFVDRPKRIEKLASQPMLYVIAVDNEMGVREVAAKYSSEFLTTKFRRLRIDQDWLDETLQKPTLKADQSRARAEDAQILALQMSLEKPITVSEYKNHPLYVLEKDLLKFEAIYPPDLEPIGTIRGHKIYPRSAVFTLQGELNWIKEARNVKPGEKPYKVVKARPKLNIPKEERTQLYLDVYGYWQTEPYVAPPVIDGKIPRNDHGNIYVYQKSMVPKGCVHLQLNGIYQVARRLELEAVQAIVGWEFSGGRNHPTIDGCVVLEKDVATLKSAWKEYTTKKAERDAKRVEEQVWDNWKKLIKGKRLLEKMRSRFK